MKKIKWLLVVLLLCCGIVRGFVWHQVPDYENFGLWNISGQAGDLPLVFKVGEKPEMYFYFSNNRDVASITMEIQLTVFDATIKVREEKLSNGCVNRGDGFPIEAGQPIEVQTEVEIPVITPTNVPIKMTVLFRDQDNMPLAGGSMDFIVEK